MTSQTAHTKYKWLPYAAEWNLPHEKFLRAPLSQDRPQQVREPTQDLSEGPLWQVVLLRLVVSQPCYDLSDEDFTKLLYEYKKVGKLLEIICVMATW